MDQPLVVLVGQTAVGKTALSLQLAQALNGEIVSADSRLFYRGMDIGTAKPNTAEQTAVPHHLIDLCTPDETITLGEYQRRAYQTIEFVLSNGRLPILVGGTGQYVKAVVEGWGIPEVPPQPKLRAALAQLPGPELARWLAALDPEAAEKHDPRNLRRVIRALEVTLVAGRPISELQRKHPPPYRILQIGLRRPREELYARIDQRVDQMMANGLLAELERLRGWGYGRSLPSMSGLGYRQLWAYLDGEMSLAEAVERIKFETHRFARHQANWFQESDPAITWFAMNDGVETAVLEHVKQWLKEGKTGNGHATKPL
ncbi:MAG: tRNA (adenosine(37)-N6)-dimethylallyltransferase MiaA [Ardenticatenaceae bacterium]|nr:tRNA (adenosine(37)-N6)-dimethylallyltransferase MiaA [Ardenticatenaceae bacterium]